MILGLSLSAFTTVHVIISLLAIATGLVVVLAMVANRRIEAMTAIFLITTISTSITGFFFHSRVIGPPHVIGAISLVILAVALFARYVRRLAGVWRPAYVVTAVLALYFNVFVLVVQAFQKIAILNAFAPTGSEPPFVAAQGAALVLFLILGIAAVRRYHPEP